MLSGAVASAESATPLLYVHKMTLVASREGEDSVVLHAERAVFDTDAETARLTGVEASTPISDRDGSESGDGMHIRCDEGEVDLATNDFVASGNVVGQTEGGREFTTDRVRYDHEAGVLSTDAPVVITDDGITYSGGGFDYVIKDRRFRLLGGARVIKEESAELRP